MHNRTSGVLSRARWLAPLAALSLFGCPKQELAPLGPCTVSAVTERVDQTGVDQVDLLFVIDNSGSMASEQKKLAALLPNLVKVLTTGDKMPGMPAQPRENNPRYFTPVRSLHIGVVTSNVGGIDDPQGTGEAINSCAGSGDDGKLQISTAIAETGVVAMRAGEFEGYAANEVVLEPDSSCKLSNVPKYQKFMATGNPDMDEDQSDKIADVFRCIAKVGVRGCPFEQQLESMWKALAPGAPPEDVKKEDEDLYKFLDGKGGQGTRYNEGFLRDEAILAIMHVSDEEDCSLSATKEGSKLLFDTRQRGEAEMKYGAKINLRCGLYGEAEDLVWPTERYVKGLKSLKPDYEDRIIFGAIVGIPAEGIRKEASIDDILERADMQFMEDGNSGLPKPSCVSFDPNDPTKSDKASPPRRFLEVAKGFGSNAVLHSICSQDYSPALDLLIDRIAKQLKGNCLPRQLRPNAQGLVECEVFELLPGSETSCDPKRGHDRKVEERVIRENGKNITRKACHMAQASVKNGKVEDKAGWFYDELSEDLKQCNPGEQQRIAFTFGDLPSGAGATFECFQPVAKVDVNAKGFDAVNTRCFNGMDMDDQCPSRNDEENGYEMMCVTPLQTCQIKCNVDPDCPPGWICESGVGLEDFKDKFCQQPTCQAGG